MKQEEIPPSFHQLAARVAKTWYVEMMSARSNTKANKLNFNGMKAVMHIDKL